MDQRICFFSVCVIPYGPSYLLRLPQRPSYWMISSVAHYLVQQLVQLRTQLTVHWILFHGIVFLTCFLYAVARTRMQSVYGGRFIGPFEALQLTYDERGRCIRRLYRGVYMNFIRSLLSWGIINSAYEKLKSITWLLYFRVKDSFAQYEAENECLEAENRAR